MPRAAAGKATYVVSLKEIDRISCDADVA